MPRGVEEDPEGLARLHLVLAGAQCDDRGLPGVEVVDLEVEVQLLGMLGAGPLGWAVVRDALERQRVPPVGASCTQSSSASSCSTGAPRTAE